MWADGKDQRFDILVFAGLAIFFEHGVVGELIYTAIQNYKWLFILQPAKKVQTISQMRVYRENG